MPLPSLSVPDSLLDLVSVFEWHAEQSPGAVAIESGDRSLTYGQLNRAAGRLAAQLGARGVGSDDLVAVATTRSPEGIVGMLGALKAGAAYVPVDPTEPAAHVDYLLDDARPRVVLSMPSTAEAMAARGIDVVPFDLALVDDARDDRDDAPGVDRSPEALAYVMYTSGSTGSPKGVMVEDRHVLQRLRGARHLQPLAGEGVLQVNRPDFDTQTWEVWGAFLAGARLVMAPVAPEPAEIAALIEDRAIDVALLSPGLFSQLVETRLEVLGSLRLALVGGDVLSPSHARRFLDAHPGVPLVNLYGPTEAVMCCSEYRVTHLASGAPVPIGRAFENSRLYLLDALGDPVRPGDVGEIVIGGDCLARGYLHRPDDTAEKFVADPFDERPGARMYRSGDRARVNADAELEFVGRVDEQVKIRGYRIEPAEVEACLRAAPGVAEAVVVSREDVPGHRRLVAYFVPSSPDIEENDAGTEAVQRFVQGRLAAHMVPSAFVAIPALPRTPRGKVDRRALPRPALSAAGGERRVCATETERRLAGIWRDVLQLDDEVGPDDQFLELGGDSLLAVRVVVAVYEELDVEIALGDVLDFGTVARLAAHVDLLRAAEHGPSELPPLEVVPRPRGSLPVTMTQAQACLISAMAEEALPYQVQALIHFEGQLDVPALVDSLSTILERHELLHTRFVRRSGAWRQVVTRAEPADVPLVDLRGDLDQDDALARLVAEFVAERLALDRAPLARWKLVRLADDHHVLLHLEHHLIHDGWSWNVFLRELTSHYRTRTEGTEPLPALDIQFADYAQWQEKVASSPMGARQLAYWKARLSDLPPPLALPSDRPRPPRQSFRGDQFVVEVNRELTDRLRSISGDSGVTLFMTMLSAFYVLLSRYGEQEDVIVGSGVANRRYRSVEKLIGMVLNTVALRADLSGDPSCLELLRQVRQTTLDAYANQDLPFEHVLQAVAPTRLSGAPPIYQVLFSFQDPLPVDLDLPGLSIVPDETVSNHSAKADLNVIVINPRREADSLKIVWQYSSDLFDADTAERMRDSYLVLLDAFARDPEARVSELALISPSERDRLVAFSGPSLGDPAAQSMVEVFEAGAREHPDTEALVWDGGRMTYRELNEAANRLAQRLVAEGAGVGTCVGVAMERSPQAVITLLATLKTGSAYLALDRRLPSERLDALVRDARPVAICVHHEDDAHGVPADTPTVVLDDDALMTFPASDLGCAIDPEDVAYLAYTSGSSGTPKAVVVPHRAVVGLVRDTDYVRFEGETFLQMAPLGFDASTFEIWGPLLNGARLAIAPPTPLGPDDIGEVVARLGVTTLWMTAGLFHQVVDVAPGVLRPLQQLVSGGDVLSPERVAAALAVMAPGSVLVNGYGPTEGTTFTTCHRMVAGEPVGARVPIGRPIHSRLVYIVGRHDELVPVGVPGEVLIGGEGVALGYHDQPDLTKERFEADRFGPDPTKLLYRSGDRARWRRDGTIEFLGRMDRQVKVRGFRVEPEGIERVLLEHPLVGAAAVLTEGASAADRRLIAYVAPEGGRPEIADLRGFVRARVAAYEVPSSVVLVDALPLGPNGKVDVAALPATTSTDATAVTPGAPRDALERKLLRIWAEVLEVKDIGPDDDFFDLGGHSLMAVNLFAAIETETGLRLPLSTIFEAPTVRQLAAVLRSNGWATPWRSLAALTATGSRPPVFFVTAGDGNSVGFGPLARRLGTDQPFYALQPRGLDGRRLVDVEVTKMAAAYVRDIRSVQRSGPYVLGGRCFGTLVAFEMTRLLESAGEKVSLLLALDSVGPLWTPRNLANGVPFDEVMNLALRGEPEARAARGAIFDSAPAADEFIAWLRAPLDGSPGMPLTRYVATAYRARPDLQAAYPLTTKGYEGLIHWTWVGGRSEMGMNPAMLPAAPPAVKDLPTSKDPRYRTPSQRLVGRAADVADVVTAGRVARLAQRRQGRLLELAARMVLEYRAGPCSAPVVLIRSEEYRGDAQLARWYGLETGGVEELYVEGSHQSMMREPDVAALARCVQGCIDRLVAQGLVATG